MLVLRWPFCNQLVWNSKGENTAHYTVLHFFSAKIRKLQNSTNCKKFNLGQSEIKVYTIFCSSTRWCYFSKITLYRCWWRADGLIIIIMGKESLSIRVGIDYNLNCNSWDDSNSGLMNWGIYYELEFQEQETNSPNGIRIQTFWRWGKKKTIHEF